MKIQFTKYQATGNDFVLIDNRSTQYSFTQEQVIKICDRRFGVGADGLMLIEEHPTLDFNLVYYNSDGSQSLCGNGSRAAVAMAATLGLLKDKTTFQAYDGAHEAELLPTGIVRLKMNPVSEVKQNGPDYFMNTGSPHHLQFVPDAEKINVVDSGRKIRYSEEYRPGGTNVNFIQLLDNNTIFVRTYERGVEDETFSCGTGVTAAALAASFQGYTSPVHIKVKGGELDVAFKTGQAGLPTGQAGTFHDIYLVGPAKMVFEGALEL
ncbi:MAG: diaminopimelate epimerase [Cyclobacteriaceae bacterium]|nr:diaminopimelate epimerase [Cyclobacteriaceae bacterium]